MSNNWARASHITFTDGGGNQTCEGPLSKMEEKQIVPASVQQFFNSRLNTVTEKNDWSKRVVPSVGSSVSVQSEQTMGITVHPQNPHTACVNTPVRAVCEVLYYNQVTSRPV